jgi:hypothetical protein
MYVVELLLPLQTRTGDRVSHGIFESISARLTLHFGGVTSFLRSPANGAWVDPQEGQVHRDEIVVVEVMTDALDLTWWSALRAELEQALDQKEIVIRAHEISRL